MSVSIDPTVPAPGEAQGGGLGASRIRNIASWLLQMFGQNGASPVTFSSPPFSVDTSGNVTIPNGQTFTLAADPTTALQAATKQYVDGGGIRHGVTTGTDTYAVTLTPTPSSLSVLTNQLFIVTIASTNTGPATLNVNGFGAINIVHPDFTPVAAGDLRTSSQITLAYDGLVSFVITGPPTLSPSVAATTYAALAGNTGQVFSAADGVLGNEVVNISQFATGSGYFKLPSGLIVEWMSGVAPGGNVNFPLSFPSACQSLVATPTGAAGTSNSWQVTINNRSSFIINSGLTGSPTFFVIAIGS